MSSKSEESIVKREREQSDTSTRAELSESDNRMI